MAERLPPYMIAHHGRYYCRIVVPKPLRDIIGKAELREALSAEKRIAVRLLPAALARFNHQLDAARFQVDQNTRRRTGPVRGRPMSERQIAGDLYHRLLAEDDFSRNTGAYTPNRGAHVYRDKLRLVTAGIEKDVGAIGAAIGWAVDDYIKRGNLELEPGSPEWRRIARTLAAVEIELLDRASERDEGNFDGKPKLPILTEPVAPPQDPLAARVLGPDSTLPLSEIVHKFLAERRIASSSQHEHLVSCRMFEEHLGEAKPVYKITRRDVIDYKNALLELPSNYVKRFPGKALPEAIKLNAARKEPYPVLDPRTVNDKWLSSLRALLNWCVENDIIPDSPATGIKVSYQADTGERKRVNFEPSDLAKIFSKPLFDRSKPWGETQWALLMSLYTGTRPSELAQVQLDSVRHEYGALIMIVQEQTKNVHSQRAIPIHAELLRLGFAEYVDKLRAEGEAHLFPEWYRDGMKSVEAAKAKANGKPVSLDKHFPKFLPRRFNTTYRKKVGIRDDRKVFYSFRHTFKTGLTVTGAAKDVCDYLTGHIKKDPSQIYVHGVSMERMKDAIDRLKFDGIIL